MSKAVMTIHGFLTDVNDFGRLYQFLDDYDCVFKCRIPGHNDDVDFSKFNAQDTFERVLKDFDELKKSYDQVDVVGVSMGGALATWLCSQRDVHKAVFVAPANKYINFGSPLRLLKFYFDTYKDSFDNAEGPLAERVRIAKGAVDVYRDNTRKALRFAKERLVPNYNLHTLTAFAELIRDVNKALEQKGKIDTPSLLLWGKLDELVPKQSSEYVTKHFPNCRVKIYFDVSHLMFFSNKDDKIIADTVEFLRKK